MTRLKLLITNSFGLLEDGGLLIHSPSRWSEIIYDKSRWFAYYPFMLASLSANLKKNITDLDVLLLDGCLLKLNPLEFEQKIRGFDPDYLFLEPAFQVADKTFDIALKIKSQSNLQVLAAGTMATTETENLLARGIDYLFKGYYIPAVTEFFRSPENLKKRIIEGGRELNFPDSVSPENYDVKRISYTEPGEPASDFKAIQAYATRGCMGNCSFCVARHLYYRAPMHSTRDLNLIIDEIIVLLAENPEAEGIFFDEEDHFFNSDFNKSLAEKIIGSGLKIRIEALGRIDHLNLDILPLMKKAGYEKFRLGIETFDEKIQKINGKVLPYSMVIEKLKIMKELGIKAHASFQLGLPGATSSSDKDTIKKVEVLVSEGLLSGVQISICTPFLGTPAYRYFQQKNALTEDADPASFNGGLRCITKSGSYSQSEVEKNFSYFVRIRDNAFLKYHLKRDGLKTFITKRIKRMGVRRFYQRSFRRLGREIQFLMKSKGQV